MVDVWCDYGIAWLHWLLFAGGDGSVVADTICLAIFNKVRDQNPQVRLYVSAASCSFHFNTEALLYFFKKIVYLWMFILFWRTNFNGLPPALLLWADSKAAERGAIDPAFHRRWWPQKVARKLRPGQQNPTLMWANVGQTQPVFLNHLY